MSCTVCGSDKLKACEVEQQFIVVNVTFEEKLQALLCENCNFRAIESREYERVLRGIAKAVVKSGEDSHSGWKFVRGAYGVSPLKLAEALDIRVEDLLVWEAHGAALPPHEVTRVKAYIRKMVLG
jgi:hypothetical protein